MAEKYARNTYVKVFASLGIYFGLVPETMVDVTQLKGSTDRNCSDAKDNSMLYAADLEGVEVSALYLMQHIDDGCSANCAFCIQAQESNHKRKKSYLVDKEMIRIPLKMLTNFLETNSKARKEIKRICIQTIYNQLTVSNLFKVIKGIREVSDVAITACCIPVSKDDMIMLKKTGLNNITINYEAATEELLDKIRGIKRNGPYRWDKVTEALDNALEVFGGNNVGSHLQIGFGETPYDSLKFIQNMHNKNILVSLFAFTPVANTAMEDYQRVSYGYFHKIQLGSYLIKKNITTFDRIEYDAKGNIVSFNIPEEELSEIIEQGWPFRNAGCPGCNRVYYETNPGERQYSYPRALFDHEIEIIKNKLLS